MSGDGAEYPSTPHAKGTEPPPGLVGVGLGDGPTGVRVGRGKGGRGEGDRGVAGDEGRVPPEAGPGRDPGVAPGSPGVAVPVFGA